MSIYIGPSWDDWSMRCWDDWGFYHRHYFLISPLVIQPQSVIREFDITPPLDYDGATVTHFQRGDTQTLRVELTKLDRDGIDLVVLNDYDGDWTLDRVIKVEDVTPGTLTRRTQGQGYDFPAGTEKYDLLPERMQVLYDMMIPDIARRIR